MTENTTLLSFVEPEVEQIKDIDPVQKVELAYRVCYKSEAKQQPGDHSLVHRMAMEYGPDRHTSPLEHAWIRVRLPGIHYTCMKAYLEDSGYWPRFHFTYGDYVIGNFRMFHDLLIRQALDIRHADDKLLITLPEAWMAVLVTWLNETYPDVFPFIARLTNTESGHESFVDRDWVLKNYQLYIDELPIYYTFRIVTSRDILQELVRHRSFSFSVESTRFCNYGNKGLQYVVPRPYEWCHLVDWTADSNEIMALAQNHYQTPLYAFVQSAARSTTEYLSLINMGCKPQEARMVLIGALKTELYMTGLKEQWRQFLTLRNTPKAHPMIQWIANRIGKVVN